MISYLVEFLGTFFFLGVIISTGQPILITLTFVLFTAFLMIVGIQSGHFNPVVSLMFFLNGSLSIRDFVIYFLAQVSGTLGALYAYNHFLAHPR